MEFRKSGVQPLTRQDVWLRKNLPLCPLCKKSSEWETATGLVLGVKRQYFRCSRCSAILSALSSDVLPAPGPIPFAITPVTLLVRVESAGENDAFTHLAGSEHKLGELQEWARKT